MYYKIDIRLKTLEDHYLLEYVENEIFRNKKIYNFTKPIRPSKFVYNQLTKQQKILYNALMDVDDCDCPICYNKLDNYNTIRTECNHSFCKECFSKMLTYSDNCPYCRSQIRKYEELFVSQIVVGLCFLFISYNRENDCVMLYNRWVIQYVVY